MRLVTTSGERLERRRFLIRRVLEEHGRLNVDRVTLARVGLGLAVPRPVLVIRPLEEDFELLNLIAKVSAIEVEGSNDALVAIAHEGAVVCVIDPGFDIGTLLDVIERVAGDGVAAGLGSARTGIGGLFRSYREARWAAKVGPSVAGGGRLARFSDLGSFRWLEPLDYAGPDDATEAIALLRAHDRLHGTHLIETLAAFLRSSLSKDAAEELFIHRNTLRYRLASIRKITGLDPTDSNDRLVLDLQQRLDAVWGPDAKRPARST